MNGLGKGSNWRLAEVLRNVVLGLLGIATLALLVASGLAFAGLLPWLPPLPRSLATPSDTSGMWLQLGLTLVAFSLVYGMVAHLRLTRLESGQRSFAAAIEDVTRARRMAPDTDHGLFATPAEPDARGARGRLFLHRQQASLDVLAGELLQAQRACDTLRQRLDEIESGTQETRHRLNRLADAAGMRTAPRTAEPLPPPGGNVIRLAGRGVTSQERGPVRPERPTPRP